MTVFDESGDCEQVACPFCHASADEGCDHVLAVADTTFAEKPSGAVADRLREFEDVVAEAFAAKLAAGQTVKWQNYALQELWDAVVEEKCDPEDIVLPTNKMTELIWSALEDAGGWDHPGSLIMGSGGYCESAIKLMYAENPAEVIALALRRLPSLLVEQPAKTKRRKKN